MRRVVIFLFSIFILLSHSPWCVGNEYPYRLFLVSSKLENDNDVVKISSIVKTASEHGLNGMVLSSPGLKNFDLESPDYIRRLKEIAKNCKEYGVEVIPMIFPVGNGDAILARDKNLAEGLLVLDAPFLVWNGDAVLMPDQSLRFPNGDFENCVGDRVNMTQLQDIPVQVIFADKKVFKEGKTSLRFEKHERDSGTKGYVAQEVRIKPYRCYRITFWVKTEDLKPSTCFLPQVQGKDNRILMEWKPKLSSTSDWQKITFGFNSFDNATVKICLGLYNWNSGKLWIDDASIEEVCPINIISRPGTPVTIRNKNTGMLYEEGYDYESIIDTQLNFRNDHEEPLIKILPGGQIKDGDRLLVSFYQGIALQYSQVALCMSEPKLYEIWRSQASAIHEVLASNKYFLNMTQIRSGGSCAACKQRGITMAQILGECITRQTNILREINPKAEIFIWSDMLDPNHNARENYYLIDGDLTGSWNYIPKDIIIVCWAQKLKNESLQHFSNLGFKMLASVYSDKGIENAVDWLHVLDKTPGASGLMYTTFENDYAKLASFGDLLSLQKGEKIVSPTTISKDTESAKKKQGEAISSIQEEPVQKQTETAQLTTTNIVSSQEQVAASAQTTESSGKGQAEVALSTQKSSGKEQVAAFIQTPTVLQPSTPVAKSVGTGIIFGLLNGTNDEALKGVKVIINGASFSDNTETDEDGFFKFSDLVAGDYTLTGEKDGYKIQKIVSNLGEGDVLDVGTIAMKTVENDIYGYVKDSIKGKPIGTTILRLRGIKTKFKSASFSDTDGFFRFTDLGEDTYLILAKKKGYKRASCAVKLGKGEEKEIELELKTKMRGKNESPDVRIESNKKRDMEEK